MGDSVRRLLDDERPDLVTSLAKGVFGLVPVIGPLAAEAIGLIIPNQKMERVVDVLKMLDEKIRDLGKTVDEVSPRFRSQEYLDILEDGLTQAARAISDERKEHISWILANSLTREDLKHAEAKVMLRILDDLTDPELIVLRYNALFPDEADDFYDLHEDILEPSTEEYGAPQSEIDRGALRAAYEQALRRHGLLNPRGDGVSSLGSLFIRYITGSQDQEEV